MDFDKCKDLYDRIPIPNNLDEMIHTTIDQCNKQENKKNIPIYKKRILVLTPAIAMLLFFIILNTSEAFARTISTVPIIGKLAQILTVTDYVEENEDRILTVKIPELKNTGHDDLENRINNEIRLKINEIVKEAEQRAKEYHQAYLDTGGKDEDRFKMEISVDYSIHRSDDYYVSFSVTKTESLASIYGETKYYNIDLSTGKEITLKQLFGDKYKSLINKEIQKQIDSSLKKDPTSFFTAEDDMPEDSIFHSISDNQMFYLDNAGDAVIVFEKYSIAPGYMGAVEFKVPLPHK